MRTHAEWIEIMNGLTGHRLGLLDHLERGVPVDFSDLKVQERLGWLIYHRFVWRARDGFVVRPTPQACELWKKEGPANEAAADVARGIEFQPPATTAAPLVQAHQVQFLQ